MTIAQWGEIQNQVIWLTKPRSCCPATLLKPPEMSPVLIRFSSVQVWKNNDLSCGVKERVRIWVKRADLSSQFSNDINFSMLNSLSLAIFISNVIKNIYIKVFVRLVSLGGNIYEESSIHQVLIKLFYWFSFNLVMLSCSGLKLIHLSWF